MRSKLFVPASRPELFAKALASEADAISFDLEDAVTESRKGEARDNLRSFLDSAEARASSKILIVRVNPIDSPHFAADLQAVLRPRLDLLNLPKPGSAQDVRFAANAMAAIEAEHHLPQAVRLLLNIETAQALRNAYVLASADVRVAGLQLGLADLFEPLAIARNNEAAVQSAMFSIRMAAGEAGVFVCDSAFSDVADAAGFEAEAQRSRALGFVGKSCIHPRQVALANRVYRPTEIEIAHALKVVESIETAVAQGRGAYLVDGKMIDPPFIVRAQAIVAHAHQLGLLSPDRGNHVA